MPMSDAERARNYRERKGATPRTELKPCGTPAAARRHQRAGEPLCPACQTAWRDYTREAQRKSRAKKSTEATSETP